MGLPESCLWLQQNSSGINLVPLSIWSGLAGMKNSIFVASSDRQTPWLGVAGGSGSGSVPKLSLLPLLLGDSGLDSFSWGVSIS